MINSYYGKWLGKDCKDKNGKIVYIRICMYKYFIKQNLQQQFDSLNSTMCFFTSRVYLEPCHRLKMELSAKILSVIYCRRKLHPTCSIEFWIHLWIKSTSLFVTKKHCTVVAFWCKLLLRIQIYTYYCSCKKKIKITWKNLQNA